MQRQCVTLRGSNPRHRNIPRAVFFFQQFDYKAKHFDPRIAPCVAPQSYTRRSLTWNIKLLELSYVIWPIICGLVTRSLATITNFLSIILNHCNKCEETNSEKRNETIIFKNNDLKLWKSHLRVIKLRLSRQQHM